MPGNKGRNAVLRSILRRASRYGWQVLGMNKPFLHNLVSTVVANFGDAFPELKRNPEHVRSAIYDEEQGFLRTLEKGIKLFEETAVSAMHKIVTEADQLFNTENTRLAELKSALTESVRAIQEQSPFAENSNVFSEMIRKIQEQSQQSPVAKLSNVFSEMMQKIQEQSQQSPVAKLSNVFSEMTQKIQEQSQQSPVAKLSNVFSETMQKIQMQLPVAGLQHARINGDTAFLLHSTCGLDIGITKQMASEINIDVDIDEFNRRNEEHERISSAGGKGLVISAVQGELSKTDDSPKYDTAVISAKVLGWVKDNAVIRSGSLTPGDAVALLLDRTNFYAEQGGQVGDNGLIDKVETPGVEFRVDDTVRLGDSVLHAGVMLAGEIAVGDTVQLMQSTFRRIDIMRNHTATHLLNLELRQVLGGHVEQKGSLVDEDKTRFDFSHDKPLSPDEIRTIEEKVNRLINRDLPVTAVTLPLDEAKNVTGARAMFGEKYPDPVRVVMIGAELPSEATHDDSIEFCGGTHMPRTGGIGYFKITAQEGVAKGIRRITAVTGRVAQQTVQQIATVVDDLTAKFQCKPEELPNRVEALQDEVKKLHQQIKKGLAADLTYVVDKILDAAPDVNGTKLIVGQLTSAGFDAVRTQIDRLRQKAKSAFIVFGWVEDDGKVTLVVALTNDLTAKKLKAGDIVKQLATIVNGSGGGKPDIAQAGGKDAAKLPEALQRANNLGRELLGK